MILAACPRLLNVDGAICSTMPFDIMILAACPRLLKLFSVPRVVTSEQLVIKQLDLPVINNAGIPGTNVPSILLTEGVPQRTSACKSAPLAPARQVKRNVSITLDMSDAL
eukprot:15835-Heterococcus_DN1.PRE.1